jgi:hypothetical protein
MIQPSLEKGHVPDILNHYGFGPEGPTSRAYHKGEETYGDN